MREENSKKWSSVKLIRSHQRNFFNHLFSLRGQQSVEYLILFTVIVLLTILGISTFYQSFVGPSGIGENFFQGCVEAILE